MKMECLNIIRDMPSHRLKASLNKHTKISVDENRHGAFKSSLEQFCTHCRDKGEHNLRGLTNRVSSDPMLLNLHPCVRRSDRSVLPRDEMYRMAFRQQRFSRQRIVLENTM